MDDIIEQDSALVLSRLNALVLHRTCADCFTPLLFFYVQRVDGVVYCYTCAMKNGALLLQPKEERKDE